MGNNMEAPDRIWANGLGVYGDFAGSGGVEYIRADLAAPTAPAEVEGLVERPAAGETVNGIKVTAYVEDKETPLGDVPAYSGHWSTPGKSARNVRRLFAEEDVMPALTAQQAEIERLREALTEIANAYTAHGYADAMDAVQHLKSVAKEAINV